MCNTLLRAISNYAAAMVLLTSHKELSDDEIEEFQSFIDNFFETWVETFGAQGMSNYLHLLGSGHIHYFLKEYTSAYT